MHLHTPRAFALLLFATLALALAFPFAPVAAQDGDGDPDAPADTRPLLDDDARANLATAAQVVLASADGRRVLAVREGYGDDDEEFNHWMLPDFGQQPVRHNRIDLVLDNLRALRIGPKVAEVSGEDPDADQQVFEHFGLVEQQASVVAVHHYGGFQRATDETGAPMTDAQGAPLFRASLQLVTAFAISPPDDAGQRYVRIADARPGASMLFGPAVWRVHGVTEALLDTSTEAWLDLSLVQRELRKVDPGHFYRVEVAGRDRQAAWQRFATQPRTVNQWQRMYQRKGLWRQTPAVHTLFTDQLDTPVTQEPVAKLIDTATSLSATNFIGEVTRDEPMAETPYLRLTLYHLGSFNGIVQVGEHDLVAMLWVFLADHADRHEGQTTIEIGTLRKISAQHIPANLLPDVIGREIGEGWLRPVELEDGDPEDTKVMPLRYPGGEIRVKALEWRIDAVQRVREMQQAFPALIPESIRAASQHLNQARQKYLQLPPNARADEREAARQRIEILQRRYEDAVVRRFGQIIDLWIEEIPESNGEQFRVASNTTNPPFRFWYGISADDVKKLEAQIDAVTPDETLQPPDEDDAPGAAESDIPAGNEVRIVGNDENPLVRLETNFGDIVFELFEDEAPNTVANFIELVENGYYDGLRSHRIVKGFVIQAGCPTTRDGIGEKAGTGGPGYVFRDEAPNDRSFDRAGLLAMANAGPDTNGSQFFITLRELPRLDSVMNEDGSVRRHYTIFGRVVSGQGTVDRIANVPVGPNPGLPGENSVPQVDVRIKRAVVVQKRDHDYHVQGKLPEPEEEDE